MAVGPKGIDVRQSTGQLVFRAHLRDSSSEDYSSGTTTLMLVRTETDGTILTYDFNDNTFKSTACTTPTVNMTHRQFDPSGAPVNRGFWTYALSTLTGFTAGGVYFQIVRNTGSSPPTQIREFQFGSAEGDMTVTSARLDVNAEAIDTDTTAPTRLVAALTTSNGIDLNMGQSTPGSPTANTTGEALRFAHEDLPNQVAAGAAGGLTTTKNADLALLNFSPDTGSTSTQIIVPSGSAPSGDADDDYNGAILIIKDVSAGNRVNVEFIADYTASTNTLTLQSALGFTPEAGVDLATVWAGSAADVLSELIKVTGGFGSTAPNTLYSHVKAMMDKTASNPSGVGTYSAATDSQEALRELLDLMAGAGFLTGTDSLEAIRNAIDVLVAPAVVSSSALSGSGFLSEVVSLVRKAIDEPSVSPKYTDSNLVEYIQVAFDDVVQELNTNTDHPVLVRHTMSVVAGTQVYQLPPNVGQVIRVARINSVTGIPEIEVWPGSELEFSGYGFRIEGNQFRFMSIPTQSETLQILYMPMGEAFIHKATASSSTSTTLVFPSSVTDGTLDTRVKAYAGYMLRILSDSNSIVQERIISDYDNITRTATVSVAFSPTLGGTIVYEVLPHYSRLIKHVVAIKAAMIILSNERNQKALAAQERQYSQKIRALRLSVEHRHARFPHSFDGNTVDNPDRQLWTGGAGVVW